MTAANLLLGSTRTHFGEILSFSSRFLGQGGSEICPVLRPCYFVLDVIAPADGKTAQYMLDDCLMNYCSWTVFKHEHWKVM